LGCQPPAPGSTLASHQRDRRRHLGKDRTRSQGDLQLRRARGPAGDGLQSLLADGGRGAALDRDVDAFGIRKVGTTVPVRLLVSVLIGIACLAILET
jgi:hypothetical protein